jgi:hypothetical protein
MAWVREVDWRACAAYSASGIPAAALGARTLLVLPSRAVDIAIGLFPIAMVPARHWLAKHQLKVTLVHLAIGGVIIGYLTGIVVSTGPLSVPLSCSMASPAAPTSAPKPRVHSGFTSASPSPSSNSAR